MCVWEDDHAKHSWGIFLCCPVEAQTDKCRKWDSHAIVFHAPKVPLVPYTSLSPFGFISMHSHQDLTLQTEFLKTQLLKQNLLVLKK